MNYLDKLPDSIDKLSIIKAHEKRQKWVNQEKKGFLRYRKPYLALSKFPAKSVECSDDIIQIGEASELGEKERAHIRQQLKAFMPWRKGPFSVYGNSIDAEWRSERKWNRVAPELPDLRGKVIADIGCNNGYYMFRMAAHAPKMVLGFEPSVQHYYCFKALNAMAGCRELIIDLLGIEHLHLFDNCFDVVFLMGIIYHRPSPIDTLRSILQSLKSGGEVILETQGIPGNQPVALFPEKTYAKVPGTYFVPTQACLVNWMKKAGFDNINTFYSHPMSDAEQRQTEWMEFESFNHFINSENPSLTVEGYPAPIRIFVKGSKKR